MLLLLGSEPGFCFIKTIYWFKCFEKIRRRDWNLRKPWLRSSILVVCRLADSGFFLDF
jgi:hypothetical protein